MLLFLCQNQGESLSVFDPWFVSTGALVGQRRFFSNLGWDWKNINQTSLHPMRSGIMFSLRRRIPLGLKSLGLRLIARFKVQRCPASCLGETRKEESWTVENTLSVGKIKILKMTLLPHREGLHLEVPAPEWVKCYLFLFYIFQFEFVPFNLFEDFFKKIFLTREVEGRKHKMEVWQSREQEREAKEREERFRRFLLHICIRGNLLWLNLFH